MTEDLKTHLQELANKYEIPSFCNEDPSQFLYWYKFSPNSEKGDRPLKEISNIECASFIAAMLAFGNRKQFIPKISQILTIADQTSGSITNWLLSGRQNFPTGEKKFYRFYSYNDMHTLFEEMTAILQEHNSLGNYFEKKYINTTSQNIGRCGPGNSNNCPLEGVAKDRSTGCSQGQAPLLDTFFADAFPKSAIVPKGKTSANKRIHMFLRWMCRQNSSVDLGIWSWYPQSLLLIPLDVHVMQEGTRLGLLPEKCTASRKTAIALTHELEQAFPNDPCRADFALFGLGVDKQ